MNKITFVRGVFVFIGLILIGFTTLYGRMMGLRTIGLYILVMLAWIVMLSVLQYHFPKQNNHRNDTPAI